MSWHSRRGGNSCKRVDTLGSVGIFPSVELRSKHRRVDNSTSSPIKYISKARRSIETGHTSNRHALRINNPRSLRILCVQLHTHYSRSHRISYPAEISSPCPFGLRFKSPESLLCGERLRRSQVQHCSTEFQRCEPRWSNRYKHARQEGFRENN